MTNHELHNTLQNVLQYMHKLSTAQDIIVSMMQEQHHSIHAIGDKMSKELDALNTAVADFATEVAANTTATDAAVAALGAVGAPASDAAALQAAADSITASNATVAANTAKLNAAVVPPVPVVPAL